MTNSRRRSSRRKGPRTGAIEVPASLMRKAWADIEKLFVRVDPPPGASREHGKRALAAALFGGAVPAAYAKKFVAIEPAPEAPLAIVQFLPQKYREPKFYRMSGSYDVPSVRYRGKKIRCHVIVADPVRGGRYAGSVHGMRGTGSGVVLRSLDINQASKAKQGRIVSAALGVLGLSKRDVTLPKDACSYYTELSYDVVVRADFNVAHDAQELFASLQNTLVHELAHVMDAKLRIADERYVEQLDVDHCVDCIREILEMEVTPVTALAGEGLTEGRADWTTKEWSAYYNLPHEVVARLSEAERILTRKQKQLDLLARFYYDKKAAAGSIVVDWAIANSSAIRSMWPHLSQPNRHRVMRAIYDMARPILESRGRRRTSKAPRRRTSR